MRILAISNLYPPAFLGGYELACAEVVTALRHRGHDITVLTSKREGIVSDEAPYVLRRLHARFSHDRPMHRGLELGAHVRNKRMLRNVVHNVKPEVLYVFNPSGLGGQCLNWLHSQDTPVVHDIFDTWLTEAYAGDVWFGLQSWASASPAKRLAKSVAMTIGRTWLGGQTPLNFRHSYFRSNYLKQEFERVGFEVKHSPVIYYGLKHGSESSVEKRNPRSLIFAGRLTPEKGIHTLLRALLLLKTSCTTNRMRVTLAGPAPVESYRRDLSKMSDSLRPEVEVTFTGPIPREQMPELFAQHSIFVFPVEWEEPFGMVLLEAMAAGLSIVATGTGGSSEIVTDGQNALIAPPRDPERLAESLMRVMSSESLRHHLVKGGNDTLKRFEFQHSIDLIEQHLIACKR